jgi:hypothetical protein
MSKKGMERKENVQWAFLVNRPAACPPLAERVVFFHI